MHCRSQDRTLYLSRHHRVLALPLLLRQVQLLGLHHSTEFSTPRTVRLYEVASSTHEHREHDGDDVHGHAAGVGSGLLQAPLPRRAFGTVVLAGLLLLVVTRFGYFGGLPIRLRRTNRLLWRRRHDGHWRCGERAEVRLVPDQQPSLARSPIFMPAALSSVSSSPVSGAISNCRSTAAQNPSPASVWAASSAASGRRRTARRASATGVLAGIALAPRAMAAAVGVAGGRALLVGAAPRLLAAARVPPPAAAGVISSTVAMPARQQSSESTSRIFLNRLVMIRPIIIR